MLYSVVLRTDPWGTPNSTDLRNDRHPFTELGKFHHLGTLDNFHDVIGEALKTFGDQNFVLPTLPDKLVVCRIGLLEIEPLMRDVACCFLFDMK